MRQHSKAITTGQTQRIHAGFRLLPLIFAGLFALTQNAWAGDIDAVFKRYNPKSTVKVDHSAWDRLLSRFLVPGDDGPNYVDYRRFKADGDKELDEYVASLEAVDVTKLNRDEQFAYWANLYNAKTIDIILEHYPVKSIKDIRLTLWRPFDGPWVADVVKVNGIDLSLNDIEHEIMRRFWNEPRVHYAVNCAAISCPNLATQAFTGERLETMLDAGARAYVNDPRGVRIKDGEIVVSKIYRWFMEDFGGNVQGVLAHVRQYAEGDLAKTLARTAGISDYEYDWSINSLKK